MYPEQYRASYYQLVVLLQSVYFKLKVLKYMYMTILSNSYISEKFLSIIKFFFLENKMKMKSIK